MEHIGIDVHKNFCRVCLLSQDGELIERRIKTERASLRALFGSRLRARALVESSTESSGGRPVLQRALATRAETTSAVLRNVSGCTPQ